MKGGTDHIFRTLHAVADIAGFKVIALCRPWQNVVEIRQRRPSPADVHGSIFGVNGSHFVRRGQLIGFRQALFEVSLLACGQL